MAALQRTIPPSSEDYFPFRRRVCADRPGGITVRYLKCADPLCQREEELTDNNAVGLPTQVLRKKFQQKGWELGKNREHDTCPTCVGNQRLARRKPREEPVTNNNGGAPMAMMVGSAPIEKTEKLTMKVGAPKIYGNGASEEPRKMDIDERRIIFATIEDRWAGKDAGYTTPWTDEKVASHLNVPLAWVAEVRSLFFGEVRDNQEIRDLLDRAAKIVDEAGKKVSEALQLQKDTSSMIVRVNAMNTTLADLRKSVEGLAAIASRIEGRVK